MPTYTQPTGNAGTMRIDDDGVSTVDIWLLGVNELVTQVPWTVTLNGQMQSWKSFRLEANLAWQKVASLFVDTTQEITFHLGASGNVKLGGPSNFVVDIPRGDLVGGGSNLARVVANGVHKRAIVWLRDEGVHKQVRPWAKKAGKWRPVL